MSLTVVHSYGPFLDFSKCLGFWPSFKCICTYGHLVNQPCSCEKSFRNSFKHWSVYCSMIIYLIVIVVSVGTLAHTVSENRFRHMSDTIIAIEGVTEVVCSCLPLFITVLQGAKFRKFIDGIRMVDPYLMTPNYKTNRRLANIAVAWCIILATVYVLCTVLSHDGTSFMPYGSRTLGTILLSLASIITAYPTVLLVQFALLAYVLSQRLKLLYLDITKSSSVADFDRFRLLHQKLCLLAKMLGELYSGLFFVIITSNLFTIIVSVYGSIDEGFSNYWTMFRTFDCVTQLLLAFWAADYLNAQVAEIENLAYGYQNGNLSLESQIKLTMLIARDHRQNVQVMAGGFFAVTLGLFPSIIASSLTYLIVIIQTSPCEGD